MQPATAVERCPLLWETLSRVHEHRAKLHYSTANLAAHTPNWIGRSLNIDRQMNDLGGIDGLYGFEMTPRSVSPFTKNCIARATSSKPMILTRMRMPVSPSTNLTRPAPANTR